MTTTLVIEGGLLGLELVERLRESPEEVPGQKPADFGLSPTARLGDEIQDAFSACAAQWRGFTRRLSGHAEGSLTSLTREQWVLPLLQVLGFHPSARRRAFEVGGRTYAISHVEGDNAVPVHIAAFDQELHRRGRERLSPHALVQEYLNVSDALWGIVTNGRRLRILRDTTRVSRAVYVEFHLEAIFEQELYPDFALLFRIAHRTRFPRDLSTAHECWLERRHQEALEEGGRVRERLREGVETALQILGSGFLEHPQSEDLRKAFANGTLDPTRCWRELLALVYRLLFLMTAEERRLLGLPDMDPQRARLRVYERWYAVERLRQRAEARRGPDPHADLWRGLCVLFDALNDPQRARALGLAALDGDLFHPETCRHLTSAAIRNDGLLEAIFHLSTFEEREGRRRTGTRRRVRFAGLDVEELGSVYESLLDYHPVVDLDRRCFRLVAGSQRKQTGSYYTPDELVQELIRSALDPVVEERLEEARRAAGGEWRVARERLLSWGVREPEALVARPDDKDGMAGGERAWRETPFAIRHSLFAEHALLSLRILDPAAGSGHFLLAAMRRLGRRLAEIRTGEAEPDPAERRRAERDVLRRCLFAVDRNPFAVDLCKVALWIEGQVPGEPLSFLDHRIRRGDSLIGVFDLHVLEEGIPDGAYKALTGDEEETAKALKKQNRDEREGMPLFQLDAARVLAGLARRLEEIAAMPEDTVEAVRAKKEAFDAFRQSDEFGRLKLACDLWCAAFFAPKTKATKRRVPTTRDVWEALQEPEHVRGDVRGLAEELAHEIGFFHWPLEFPEAMAAGGFDVVLGNPPWEQIQFDEQEFFRERRPDIAALEGERRKQAIAQLREEDSDLWKAYVSAHRKTEAIATFVKTSKRFPLSARGKLNLYGLFAELAERLHREDGRAGLVVPTGIATDKSTSAFFARLLGERRLAALFDFENREGLFPAVDSRQKFCLLVLARDVPQAEFAFFLTRTEHLRDPRRRFTLSPEDTARINPNTKTAPIFRTRADAELTWAIYARVPVLVREGGG